MSRSEYMFYLKEALQVIDKELADEIIQDYEAHFDEAIQAGRKEEDICAEIGSIKELVEELKKIPDYQRQNGNSEKIISEKLNCQEEKSEQQDRSKNVHETYKVNTSDLILKNRQSAQSDCHKVFVDAGNANLIVKPSETDQIFVEFRNYGNMKQQILFQLVCRICDDTAVIELKKAKTAESIFSRIITSFSLHKMEILLFLPKNMVRTELKTSSGQTQLEHIESSELSIHNASGNIYYNHISGSIVDFSCISGCIEGTWLNADRICMKNISGKVKGSHLIGQSLTASITSGNIDLEGSFEDCLLSNKSGNIALVNEGSIKASISSISGNIKVAINNDGQGYEADVKVVSGVATLCYGAVQKDQVKNGHFVYGMGKSSLFIKAVSGNISVKA